VTDLREMMLEELQRINYSEDATHFYVRVVEDFSRRFNRPPRLGCSSLARLFTERVIQTQCVSLRRKSTKHGLCGPCLPGLGPVKCGHYAFAWERQGRQERPLSLWQR
jgi:hypothetical protein